MSSDNRETANAWDVVSVRLFEFDGFRAIGTTGAGVAPTLGYREGQRMTLEENPGVVRRIVASVLRVRGPA
jgi:2-methylisocitrate lyase-like PEP mutase family enzyme